MESNRYVSLAQTAPEVGPGSGNAQANSGLYPTVLELGRRLLAAQGAVYAVLPSRK